MKESDPSPQFKLSDHHTDNIKMQSSASGGAVKSAGAALSATRKHKMSDDDNVSKVIYAKRLTRKPATRFSLANFELNTKLGSQMYDNCDVTYTITTQNRFDAIQTKETDNNDMEVNETEITGTENKRNATDETPKNKPLPTLFVRTNRHKELTQFVNKECPHTTIKHNVEHSTIKTTSEADNAKLNDFLATNNMEYYTFSANSAKPAKLLIKYIPLDYTKEEIQQDLHNQGINAHQVTRYIKHTDNKKQETTMIIINIPKSQQEIAHNLKHVCGITIRIEPFKRNNNNIPQCHNCLNYGHSSYTCRMNPRCVKCAGNHAYEKCPNLNEKSFCANCKQEHKASYRGCSTYKYAKSQIKNTQTKPAFTYSQKEFPTLKSPTSEIQPSSPIPRTLPVTQNYTNTNAWGPKPQENATLGGMVELGQLFKQANISHIIPIVKNMLIKCINARSDAEKAVILLEEIGKLN